MLLALVCDVEFLLTSDDLIYSKVLLRSFLLFSEFEVCRIYDFWEPESFPDVPVVPFLFWDSLESLVTVLYVWGRFCGSKFTTLDVFELVRTLASLYLSYVKFSICKGCYYGSTTLTMLGFDVDVLKGSI